MQTTASTLQKMQQRTRERNPIFSSDGSVLGMSDILETHAPDNRNVDIRSLLYIVEDILQRATPSGAMIEQPHIDVAESMTHNGMHKLLAYDISKIGREILCNCFGSGDAIPTAVQMFKMLSNYSWDAKAVLALAAFAMNYGDFWLTAHLYTTNPLAKSIAVLRQLPNILSHTNTSLKPRLDALNNLIKAMLDMIKCIMEFSEFPPEYIASNDSPGMSMATTLIPTGVYWTVRGVIACSSQFNGLLGMSYEHVGESWELSTLAHKIGSIHGHLREQLNLCRQDIEEKKRIQVYQNLVRLFGTTQVDNLKVLKALIYSKDDRLPLVDGPTKTRVGVEVLRRKTVMLMISDLDIPQGELMILEQVYQDIQHGKAERPYVVVWLPVLDSSTVGTDASSWQDTFNRLQSSMPWYSLHHPSLLHPAVIKYIKDEWHFDKKPLLVVLDPQGRVICPNALHMMWIWGSVAYPFTRKREEDLWNEETWRIELLADGIDISVLTWIKQGKLICLYGGEDMNWIRNFTSTMQRIVQGAKLPLEMVYVGKSNPKERVRKNIMTIMTEKLSHCWQDLTSIWFFWARLESMWYSKMQHDKTIETDSIMRGVVSMLTFDGSENGWAVIGKGTGEMAKAPGKKILQTLMKFDEWKVNIEREGFTRALIDALASYQSHEHCARLVLPRTPEKIHEQPSCVECGRSMEKYILYRCCDD